MTTSSPPTPPESWTRNAYYRAAINFSKNLVDQIELETKGADEDLLRREAASEHVRHRFEKQLAHRLRRQTDDSFDATQDRYVNQEEEDKKRKQDLFEIREAFPLGSLEDEVEYHLRIILRNKLVGRLKQLEIERLENGSGTSSYCISSAAHSTGGRRQHELDGPNSTAVRNNEEILTDTRTTCGAPLSASTMPELYFIPKSYTTCSQENKRDALSDSFSISPLQKIPFTEGISTSSTSSKCTNADADNPSNASGALVDQEQSVSAAHIAEFEAVVLARSNERREMFLENRLQHFRSLKKNIIRSGKTSADPRSTKSLGVKRAVKNSGKHLLVNDFASLSSVEKQIETSLKKLQNFQKERKDRAKKMQRKVEQIEHMLQEMRTQNIFKEGSGKHKNSLLHSFDTEKLIRGVIHRAMEADLCAEKIVNSDNLQSSASCKETSWSTSSAATHSSLGGFSEKFFQPISLPMELSATQDHEVHRYLWPSELERRISHCLYSVAIPSRAETKWRPVLWSSRDVEMLSACATESGEALDEGIQAGGKVSFCATTPPSNTLSNHTLVENSPSSLSLVDIASYGASPRRPVFPAVGYMGLLQIKGRGEGVSATVHFQGCEV